MTNAKRYMYVYYVRKSNSVVVVVMVVVVLVGKEGFIFLHDKTQPEKDDTRT